MYVYELHVVAAVMASDSTDHMSFGSSFLDVSIVLQCTCPRVHPFPATADMDGLLYSPDDPYCRLGPVHTCIYVRIGETVAGNGWTKLTSAIDLCKHSDITMRRYQ